MNQRPRRDTPVVDAARQGDRSAMQQLCRAAAAHLEHQARARLREPLRSRYRTSDLVQSALLEALHSLSDFRGATEAEFVQWTLRILENNVRDRQRFWGMAKRAIGREQELEGAELSDQRSSASPSHLAINREELHLVAQAIASLPTDQQRVLHCVVLRGMSHVQTAGTLGRTEEACRALLARARAGLVRQLDHLRRQSRG
jgi:RNA polymerase sigma-70 factor (ECF subfamily)